MSEKTVALYLRVSTKHQDTPEGSLISQEQRLIEWYDYHNSQAKHSKEKDPYSKYVIYKDLDESTMASILDEEDLPDELVKTIEFDTLKERDKYIKSRGWD